MYPASRECLPAIPSTPSLCRYQFEICKTKQSLVVHLIIFLFTYFGSRAIRRGTGGVVVVEDQELVLLIET